MQPKILSPNNQKNSPTKYPPQQQQNKQLNTENKKPYSNVKHKSQKLPNRQIDAISSNKHPHAQYPNTKK